MRWRYRHTLHGTSAALAEVWAQLSSVLVVVFSFQSLAYLTERSIYAVSMGKCPRFCHLSHCILVTTASANKIWFIHSSSSVFPHKLLSLKWEEFTFHVPASPSLFRHRTSQEAVFDIGSNSLRIHQRSVSKTESTSCAGGRHDMPRPLQVDLWPFDLESGVRVTCDVGYLCASFSLPTS